MASTLQLLCALLSLSLMAAAAPAPPGAVEEVSASDPEVQACASFALESFNFFDKDPNLYTITKYYSVKRINIGGGEYDIDVQLSKTQCLKTEKEHKDCQILTSSDAKSFRCHFSVLSVPWKNQRVLLKSSCVL